MFFSFLYIVLYKEFTYKQLVMAATLKNAEGTIETFIHFTTKSTHRYPYIKDLFNYSIDLTLNEGTIEFDGYYYVHDEMPEKEWERQYSEVLPTRLLMDVIVMDANVKPIPDKPGSYRQETIMANQYYIEVYKREYIKNTNVISTIDDDGDEMRVCFFPTDHQRLHFRILKEVKSAAEVPDSFGDSRATPR